MKISRLALLLLLGCAVTSYAQESPGGIGRFGSSVIASQVIRSQARQDVARIRPAPAPDYASYNKNPTFKKLRILSKPDAGYTEEARRNNVSGQVVLRVLFAETGQVTRIRVVSGLPFGLTERAIDAARQIEFEPAELDGKKVAYPLSVVYNFRRH
jgi:TonB family protein